MVLNQYLNLSERFKDFARLLKKLKLKRNFKALGYEVFVFYNNNVVITSLLSQLQKLGRKRNSPAPFDYI